MVKQVRLTRLERLRRAAAAARETYSINGSAAKKTAASNTLHATLRPYALSRSRTGHAPRFTAQNTALLHFNGLPHNRGTAAHFLACLCCGLLRHCWCRITRVLSRAGPLSCAAVDYRVGAASFLPLHYLYAHHIFTPLCRLTLTAIAHRAHGCVGLHSDSAPPYAAHLLSTPLTPRSPRTLLFCWLPYAAA